MVVKEKTLQGYMDRTNFILDHIEHQYQSTPFWNMLWMRIDRELEAIKSNPKGERGMEFADTNSRYPYANTIPGLLAEVIAAINIHTVFGWEIVFAVDAISQVKDTIKFWTGMSKPDQTVQVKAVRIVNNQLDRQQELLDIKSDWVCLVDIDSYHHFFISNKLLQIVLQDGEVLTYDKLDDIRTRYFNNTYLYGTPEDRMVYNNINSKK